MAIGDGVSAIASLALTFGGFSPTAMDGVEATKAQIERVEAQQAARKEATRRLRELEFAKTSEIRTFEQNDSICWDYVVVDGELVRLVGCRTTQTHLSIPDEIEGLRVYAIGSDACAGIEAVTDIECPDSVEAIGSYAFRQCSNLKRIILSACVSTYSASWFQECNELESIVLPGQLEKLTSAVLDRPKLKSMVIGPATADIEPGMFRSSRLEIIVVDNDNPFLWTDGKAIYSKEGNVLLAMAVPSEAYSVDERCAGIGRKAFDGRSELREVALPNGLVVIDEFAFTHAGIESLTAPQSLKEVRSKAFYYCRELKEVTLNEGLTVIGDSAFEESGLNELSIPSTIESIGTSITARTNVVHRGPDCSISIHPACKTLFLDGNGGLYRHEDDGTHLIQLIDRDAEEFNVLEGTRVVDDHAFAFNDKIREVFVPDGVVAICHDAFRHCTNLEHVHLPDSVTEIGDSAFIDTALVSFTVPRSLEKLGKDALVTSGAHHGDEMPTLVSVDVAEGNERFYVECGMLCSREQSGDRVVVFTSSCPRVVFPQSIVAVEQYAFNNARGIEYLSLNEGLKTISTSGLTTWCWIEHIHVDVAEPIEGRTSFDFHFPDTQRSLHGISVGIGGASWVNVPGVMAQYDICVINAHDYNSPRNPDSIPVYEQARMAVERLLDPVLLTPFNKGLYERLLRNHVVEICVDIARHDDRELVDRLVDLGYVNDDNIEEVIAAVTRLQDAAMTGYLLEVKRRRFGRGSFDFDL